MNLSQILYAMFLFHSHIGMAMEPNEFERIGYPWHTEFEALQLILSEAHKHVPNGHHQLQSPIPMVQTKQGLTLDFLYNKGQSNSGHITSPWGSFFVEGVKNAKLVKENNMLYWNAIPSLLIQVKLIDEKSALYKILSVGSLDLPDPTLPAEKAIDHWEHCVKSWMKYQKKYAQKTESGIISKM